MTGEQTVVISPVRAGGRHCDKPRVRRKRRPLPSIVVTEKIHAPRFSAGVQGQDA